MVRSLYSGVTGMKAHQTRLDVIGNNIANVNTFGFKSSSVTFRDVYYQSLRGASAGDATTGGMNPSQVGYGTQVGSIDMNMTQSISSTTGNPWDLSIGGEGFFQVQDSDGNIYYTRAGKLGYDNNGYLVDSNGNFVLGTSGSPLGKAPGSSRIQMNIPSVNPTKPAWSSTIDNVTYTLTASKESTDGNVTVNFQSKTLDAGILAEAKISSTGITVTLNSDAKFANLSDMNAAINNAITVANGGEPHPGGQFTMSMVVQDGGIDKFAAAVAAGRGGLTGKEICETVSSPTLGSIPGLPDIFSTKGTDAVPGGAAAKKGLGFQLATPCVGDAFSGKGAMTVFTFQDLKGKAKADGTGNYTEHAYEISISYGADVYKGVVTEAQMQNGRAVVLQKVGGEAGDTIRLTCPSEENMLNAMKENATLDADGKLLEDIDGAYTFAGFTPTLPPNTDVAVPTTKSTNIGLNSQPFTLKEGTEGGPQTLADVSGFKIGADGIITVTHRGETLELGRIDLVNFENPSGLEQSSNTYFAATGNSGNAKVVQAGTSGTGNLASSTLEMSNVDLSQEFADVITTQRGFQANSRIVTVTDTMLEELINLKR